MTNSEAPCSTDPIIVNETSFFSWLNTGDRSCPTPQQVSAAIKQATASSTTSTASGGSNSVYYGDKQLSDLTKRHEQRKQDVQIAHDRAVMASRPELTASYYDGWFPLNRPMKNGNVPILIGVATFFFTISILLLLEVIGITIGISAFVPYLAIGTPNEFTKSFWRMAFVALIFFVIMMYLFFR